MKRKIYQFCIGFLSIICLSGSLLITPVYSYTAVFAQDIEKMSSLYSVSVKTITKNVGDIVTGSEILDAVTSNAPKEKIDKKTLLNVDAKKVPLKIEKDGYYSFSVQVVYLDKTIKEVTVKVVTPYDTPTSEEGKLEEDKASDAWESASTENISVYDSDEIKNINVAVTKPIEGNTPIFNTEISLPEGIQLGGIYWIYYNNDGVRTNVITNVEELNKKIEAQGLRLTKFGPDGSYMYFVVFSAQDSSVYENVRVKFNGEDVDMQKVSGNGVLSAYKIYNPEKKISEEKPVTEATMASQYNLKGQDIVVNVGDKVDPLLGIYKPEAFKMLPEGTILAWKYGEPKTDKKIDRDKVSISVKYPDGTEDIVYTTLTVKENYNDGISEEKINTSVTVTKDTKTANITEKDTPTIVTKNTSKPDLPQTGDETSLVITLAGVLISLGAIITLIFKKRDNKKLFS